MREIRIDQIMRGEIPVEGKPPKIVYRVLLGLYVNDSVQEARVYEEADIKVTTLQAAMQRFADEFAGRPKSVPIPSGVKPIILTD